MANNKNLKLYLLTAAVAAFGALGAAISLSGDTGSDQAQKTPQVELAASPKVAVAEAAPVNLSTAQEDKFILLPGGEAVIGSPESELQRGSDETLHRVKISPFYVDPYEVTQRDYAAVMGKNPSHFKGDRLPVDSVTWFDAVQYCNELSRLRGLAPVYTIEGTKVTWHREADGYRLLTEAEWEYAARAGTSGVFNAGGQITSENANFQGHYPYLIEANYVSSTDSNVVTSTYRGTTIAVDSLAPNQFGLYNMYGNVSEWCFDYYGAYDIAAVEDPAGAASGSLRVNRGGGYNDFAKHLRSAYRSATSPDDPDRNLGFRLARNAQPGKGSFETAYALDIKVPENPRILVAYFSYSGNTAKGAAIISEKTGGDLFRIDMQIPYRGNIYEVSQIDLNMNIHPALASHVDNMGQYDLILLGYPTWWATMPMPVATFLEEYDFRGKKVVTFSSHGGTGFGESVSDVAKMLPGSLIGQALEYRYSGYGTLERDISQWLSLNGIKEK